MINQLNKSKVEIEESEEQLTIRIPPNRSALLFIMIIWLILWVCGGLWILFSVLQNFNVVMIIVAIFWIVGIVLVVKRILWELFGLQKITVTKDFLLLERSILNKIHSKKFDINLINGLQLEQSEDELIQSIDDEDVEPDDLFDDGMLQFLYQKSIVHFASEINESDAKLIESKIKHYLD